MNSNGTSMSKKWYTANVTGVAAGQQVTSSAEGEPPDTNDDEVEEEEEEEIPLFS
jgi:hypothetical protein